MHAYRKDTILKVEAYAAVVPSINGRMGALDIGLKTNASHVIWGWYSTTRDYPIVKIYIDTVEEKISQELTITNLDDPRVKPETYVDVFRNLKFAPGVSEALHFDFILHSSKEVAAAAQLIVAFTQYISGNFETAERLLIEARLEISENADLTSYCNFILANIAMYRAGPGGDDWKAKTDYLRSAMVNYYRSLELLLDARSSNRDLLSKTENNIASLLMRHGYYESAIALLERAVSRSPYLATAQANYGLASLNLGDLAGATESLRKSLEINPSLTAARIWLAIAYLKENDSASASDVLEPIYVQLNNITGSGYTVPTEMVTTFLEFFGVEFLTSLIKSNQREHAISELEAYMERNLELVHMYSSMNPDAMDVAGERASIAGHTIARLRDEDTQGSTPGISGRSENKPSPNARIPVEMQDNKETDDTLTPIEALEFTATAEKLEQLLLKIMELPHLLSREDLRRIKKVIGSVTNPKILYEYNLQHGYISFVDKDYVESARFFQNTEKLSQGKGAIEAMFYQLSALRKLSDIEGARKTLSSLRKRVDTLQKSDGLQAQYDYLICLWSQELAILSHVQMDVSCLLRYRADQDNFDINIGWYLSQAAKEVGSESEWERYLLKILENGAPTYFTVRDLRALKKPLAQSTIVDRAFDNLTETYRKNRKFEKIGGLLFEKNELSDAVWYSLKPNRVKRLEATRSM